MGTLKSDISRFIVAGVNDIFTKNWESYPVQHSTYTTAKKATKETMIYDSVGNLKPAVTMQESEAFQYGKVNQAYETRITVEQIGNGISYSLKGRKFDLYNTIDESKVKELAHTMRDIEEEKAADPWNDAFTVNLADGVPMCSNSKPLLHVPGQFNDTLTTGACTGASGYDNIKLGVKMFSRFKNHQNKPMKSYPDKILTHEVQMMDLEEILSAQKVAYEFSNTPNKLPKLSPVYSRWLDSETAWFLIDSRFEHVLWLTHTGITMEWEENFQNKDLEGTIYELVAAGALPNIGVVGSLGT